MEKKRIRKALLHLRKRVKRDVLKQKSRLISNVILKLDEYKKAKIIAFYSHINNEVDLDNILARAIKNGKKIVLPRVKKHGLEFYRISKRGDLQPGTFDILEPRKGLSKISANKIDLFLIPGVAFDISGNRIGYGKGYFDSVLKKRKKSSCVCGVSYFFQILERLPDKSGDYKMDKLVFENGIIDLEK